MVCLSVSRRVVDCDVLKIKGVLVRQYSALYKVLWYIMASVLHVW